MEYHKLQLDVAELEKKIMSEIIRPERVLLFLVPGRLVCSFIYFIFLLNTLLIAW
jgi:rRNA-processing arch domain